MPTIQRQTILSSIFIYAGFFIGAGNMLLTPFVLEVNQLGLTKVVNDVSVLFAAIASFGTAPVVSKFYPYYRHFVDAKKNDLLFLVVTICSIGAVLMLGMAYLFKPYIIIAFGRNDQEIFSRFYWVIFPYLVFYLAFLMTEPFFWIAGKSAFYNLLKETGFRLLTTVFLVLVFVGVIHFTGFMWLYSVLYLIPAGLAIFFLYRSGKFSWQTQLSKVTRRMKRKMVPFASFVFFTGLLTLIVRVCDTLFIAGQKSFAEASVFIYALYFSQILDVPNRSITGGATPVLAEYWRQKNLDGIESVYRKSAMTLLIAGVALGGLIVINLNNAIRFLPESFASLKWPTILLVIAQLVTLATGLNALIIHTSSRWRFDFVSTIIYSLVSIPLNFVFIRYLGIIGAALATLVSSLFYNIYRWAFLLKEYNMQPLSWRNVELLLISIVLIVALYLVPALPNLYLDVALRSFVFVTLLGTIVISRRYADEVNQLWDKWSEKAMLILKK